MPQASDDLRDLMNLMFENGGIDDDAPINFLQSRGYTLTKQYTWVLPPLPHSVTEKESLCIKFLIDEWDFGDIEGGTKRLAEWETTIETTYDDGFVMDAPRGKWIVPNHGLHKDDKVKITIEKISE